MNSLKLLLISSAVAFVAVSAAQADPAGSYKLAIGAKATCAVTLVADGTATFTGACDQGSDVARWQAKSSGVELKKASGETVAMLKGKDGSYTGTRFEDGRTLTLSVADGAAVASTH